MIVVRSASLAVRTVEVLNHFGRKIGQREKAFVIQNAEGRRRLFEIHHPEAERADVKSIIRLLILGYRPDEITPIMIAEERYHSRVGAKPE